MVSERPVVSRSRFFLRTGLFIAVALLVFWGLRLLRNSALPEQILQWLSNLKGWAPLVFVLIYIVCVLGFMPASLLTLGAGILFGFLWGSIYVFIGALISSTLCFVIARRFGRHWIAKRIESDLRFRAIDDATAREGWKIVALVRIAPMFPFSISNYAFGLTRVPLWHYIGASFAMIPGTALYVYFGTVIGDLAGIRSGVALPLWLKWTIGIVTVLTAVYLTRFARRALKQRL